MRAQRTMATEGATTFTPRMARSTSLSLRHSQGTSAVYSDVDRQSDTQRAPGSVGHHFGSIGIYPKSDDAAAAGQRMLPEPTGGRTSVSDGRAIVRRHPHRLSASIRRVSQPFAMRGDEWSVLRRPARTEHAVPARRSDAEAGKESASSAMDVGSLLALTQQGPIEGLREPQIGETVDLPGITLQPQAAMVRSDKIAGVLDYHPVINKTGTLDPGDFGAEILHPCALSGVTVTKTPQAYSVSATVEQLITYQVRSAVGPSGQVDIASETDPDIVAGNYVAVADDLKPDMAKHGRPPRTNFWAEDITTIHEKFHADEDVEFVRTAVLGAQAWLNRQTAASVAGVNTHLAAVPARILSDATAANPAPGYEDRAYFDGAGLYQGRSNAIRAKGAAGGYAASPGPAAASAPAAGTSGLSRGAKVGIGIGAGALAGAAIGAAGGLIGLAVGAGIGAVAGLIGGLLA